VGSFSTQRMGTECGSSPTGGGSSPYRATSSSCASKGREGVERPCDQLMEVPKHRRAASRSTQLGV
jgi:hypothetical protein